MLLTVEIPEGLQPGDVMCVSHGSQEFTLFVPDGMCCGEQIDVDLPVEDDDDMAPDAAPSTVLVVVPDGCFEGSIFAVDLDGRQFDIAVPAGCGPGVEIEVEVPAEEPPSSKAEPTRLSHQRVRRSRESREAAEPADPQLLVGRRVALCGLIARGLLNGRKGHVQSYMAPKHQLVVTIDGMCPDVCVPPEHVRALPHDDVPDPDDDEPPEAPPAGMHYAGDRVVVERSSGRTSLATIVEYDEVMETYTLDLGAAGLKYGVEESYITPHETSVEWAGPSRRVDGRWEGYYVGRRVRVPTMLARCDDDDKNGSVRGYDAATGFYVVELDSGVVRRTVMFKDIRVVYQLHDDQPFA